MERNKNNSHQKGYWENPIAIWDFNGWVVGEGNTHWKTTEEQEAMITKMAKLKNAEYLLAGVVGHEEALAKLRTDLNKWQKKDTSSKDKTREEQGQALLARNVSKTSKKKQAT
eukprot:10892371-Heterocapsa_arctica.AAC.1